jgi:hypothetical protein
MIVLRSVGWTRGAGTGFAPVRGEAVFAVPRGTRRQTGRQAHGVLFGGQSPDRTRAPHDYAEPSVTVVVCVLPPRLKVIFT